MTNTVKIILWERRSQLGVPAGNDIWSQHTWIILVPLAFTPLLLLLTRVSTNKLRILKPRILKCRLVMYQIQFGGRISDGPAGDLTASTYPRAADGKLTRWCLKSAPTSCCSCPLLYHQQSPLCPNLTLRHPTARSMQRFTRHQISHIMAYISRIPTLQSGKEVNHQVLSQLNRQILTDSLM